MIPQESLLILLVRLIDRIPVPAPTKAGRGHPKVYSDRLFLKALVIMIVRHLHTVHELLSVLAQPTAEMLILRGLLTENGRSPHPPDLGAPSERLAGELASPNRLFGALSGRTDPALGRLWASGGDGQYGPARQRRGLAQKGP